MNDCQDYKVEWRCVLMGFLLGKTPYYNMVRRLSFVRRRPSRSEAVAYLENILIEDHQILFRHPHQPTTYPTSTSDMTSLTTSGWKLSRNNCRKCRLRWLRVEFLENGLSEDPEICTGNFYGHIGDNWLHKSAGYDVTSCLQSAAKFN